MARFETELNESLRQFIAAQHVFLNASAPRNGRINISPKGRDSLRILNDKCVAYLDLTGSENETAAHIAENGRLTLMFCSFEDEPRIVRLYGRGRVIRPRDPAWEEMHFFFRSYPGERQIIVLDIESIVTTCGFAVPLTSTGESATSCWSSRAPWARKKWTSTGANAISKASTGFPPFCSRTSRINQTVRRK
jgi:hypothetical protein